jgi:hypothetical protein
VADSIRIAADTSGMRIINGDTIRYRNSRVIVREKKPFKIRHQQLTKLEVIALVLLFVVSVGVFVK